MSLFQGLSFVLMVMLVVVPPGGSACWPLPDGRHLHIGWSDPDGHDTFGLSVFIHDADQPARGFHQLAVGAVSLPKTSALGDVFLSFVALGLVLPIPLCWRDVARMVARRQPGPSPLEFPPRQFAAS